MPWKPLETILVTSPRNMSPETPSFSITILRASP